MDRPLDRCIALFTRHLTCCSPRCTATPRSWAVLPCDGAARARARISEQIHKAFTCMHFCTQADMRVGQQLATAASRRQRCKQDKLM